MARDLNLSQTGDLELSPALPALEEDIETGDLLGLDPLRGPGAGDAPEKGQPANGYQDE